MNASDPAAGRWNDRRTLWMLVALLPLAFAARVLVAGDAFGSDGEILIARNDASYHARRALYTFENFPRILWFDSYLAWPDGAPVPMPPLYDWALGAAARAFGSSERVFERVLAWAPPMLGTLALLPVFAAGRRVAGPRVGLLAAAILCVLPLHAEFSRLGNADHHAWVALLSACWLALVLRSIRNGEGEGEERGGEALAVALRAAVMMAVLLSWSGSVLLIAVAEGSLLTAWVFGGGGRSLRIQAWAAAVASAGVVPWVAMAPTPLGGAFSSTTLSWLHPTVLIGLAGLSGGLALFERRRASRDVSERALRATTLGLLIVGILFVFLPLWESLAPGVRFVSGEDVWRNRNPEQQPLFYDLWSGQKRIGLPHVYYGAFAYLIPLAPVAIVPLLRAVGRRPAGVVLAVWYAVFGTLALLQLRYGNDFAIPGVLTFALLLNGAAGWVASRLPSLRGREGLVATGAAALLMAPAFSAFYQKRIPSVVSKIVAAGSDVHPLASSEALTRLMIALRGATPETGGYLDGGRPEYGVLVRPGLGHLTLYRGRRATPAGNFGPYLDPEKLRLVMAFYFRVDSDSEALEILRTLDVRYLVTEPDYPAREGFVRRLHDGNGSAEPGGPHADRFRLVTESPAASGTPGTLKVFEFVPGADVRIETAPEAEVRAEIPLVTPTGREFRFRTHMRASPTGLALLRLPYATSGNGAVRALGPYRIEAAGESQQLAVSEEGVRTGHTIRLHIGR
jgi:dolichyl-diphosphooligosaccharide--protein glycosyltransferase